MKNLLVISATLALAATIVPGGEAHACGGCFVPPEEGTQVTGHRMVLSVGKDQSTLYDQIEYDGDPAEFAWVLPTKGQVDVGVSSDLLFNQLGFDTAVAVLPPVQQCPSFSCPGAKNDAAPSAGAGNAGPGVEVIAQEVVGPYETVQLSADEPGALNNWLDQHGYNIPVDIQPVVAAYVNDDYNFLAIKLVPGVGIDRMQPVRITTAGSNAMLPLRMVAAGTGATTAITLWVVGEGRYETANFPTFAISEDLVVWDYATSSSNYTELRDAAYSATEGFGWLVEAATPYSKTVFRGAISNAIDFLPLEETGYDDGSGDFQVAHQAADEDIDLLFAGINGADAYVTRLRAELSRQALTTDLQLAAAEQQVAVSNRLQTRKFVGTQPACPPPPECGDDAYFFGQGAGSSSRGTSGCAAGRDDSGTWFGSLLVLIIGLGVHKRRRRRQHQRKLRAVLGLLEVRHQQRRRRRAQRRDQ